MPEMVSPSKNPVEDPDVKRALELGIDLAQIDDNLRLTPLERMRQHDESVRQILAARAKLGIVDE